MVLRIDDLLEVVLKRKEMQLEHQINYFRVILFGAATFVDFTILFLSGEKVPIFLTYAETTAMIDACKRLDNKAIILLLITAGLRRGELIKMKVNDIYDHTVLIRGKGNKVRPVIIQDEAYEALIEYLEYRIEKYGDEYDNVFISQRNQKPYSGEGIRNKINAVARKAGIPEE